MGNIWNRNNENNGKRKLTKNEKVRLYDAIVKGNDEETKALIVIMENINENLNNAGTVLNICCHFGRKELVKYLIELGADVNITNLSEYSTLIYAIRNRHIEIIKILIEAGADINYINQNGISALSEALRTNHLEVFELLISSGVDIVKCGGKALIFSCQIENIQMIERLVEVGVDVNYVDFGGCTSLHYACEHNNLKVVELLLENGANENIKNKYGTIPIDFVRDEDIKEYIKNYKTSKFILK